ncbi:hypothetical protein EB354_05210 [Chryseobacterium balustinum]|uniref:Uncharacterized protein n=1 Tax=Chryseobacterium balustinum TaxID=246 RepID=A0AAQ1S6Q1_9FLAO|nr:hypothetical protein EB354_05165 [Chryseobacterium balustinum]AZB28706.1 hypothetical protein EB354_05210 [Chryseobacterium balustinum]SKC07094.1 hypothetical protein SAMN05421800_12638 [Chryseobacterium balustinum]SKC07181.1 hypothetical protein SAMN05421800_12647 [Chryseobacterium balustinum]SQA91834.1 Uncharacterised protein [Chryseobacterium balustinum]
MDKAKAKTSSAFTHILTFTTTATINICHKKNVDLWKNPMLNPALFFPQFHIYNTDNRKFTKQIFENKKLFFQLKIKS